MAPFDKPDFLRREREGRGITQQELADRAGVSRSWLKMVEIGKRKISNEKMDLICGAMVEIEFERNRKNTALRLPGYVPRRPANTLAVDGNDPDTWPENSKEKIIWDKFGQADWYAPSVLRDRIQTVRRLGSIKTTADAKGYGDEWYTEQLEMWVLSVEFEAAKLREELEDTRKRFQAARKWGEGADELIKLHTEEIEELKARIAELEKGKK